MLLFNVVYFTYDIMNFSKIFFIFCLLTQISFSSQDSFEDVKEFCRYTIPVIAATSSFYFTKKNVEKITKSQTIPTVISSVVGMFVLYDSKRFLKFKPYISSYLDYGINKDLMFLMKSLHTVGIFYSTAIGTKKISELLKISDQNSNILKVAATFSVAKVLIEKPKNIFNDNYDFFEYFFENIFKTSKKAILSLVPMTYLFTNYYFLNNLEHFFNNPIKEESKLLASTLFSLPLSYLSYKIFDTL